MVLRRTGYSSGQAIQVVREVAEQTLPAGYGFEFGGMSREESSTGNTTTLVFIICVVFIYLILCALYESLFIPIGGDSFRTIRIWQVVSFLLRCSVWRTIFICRQV